MPCWYYDKKDLKNTPSSRDGMDANTETRYRREGARFIIEVGTKLGLRHDCCATGVTYFNRFYMLHSFRDFHHYVTGACCLFLAGKVEETPKKCKDIIRIIRAYLNDEQFAVFGEDPREEVMTQERVLLQTLKFDLQVEHAYAYLLRFAKFIKGDKAKVQKMVQMAWTFINDSLCTSVCLQWEPDIVAVSVMYLASRLNKFDITDWQGKQANSKLKWYEALVSDISLEVMEDVCHQVLDLYSPQKTEATSTPPPTQNKPTAPATEEPKPQPPAKKSRPAPSADKVKQKLATTQAASSSGPPAKRPATESAQIRHSDTASPRREHKSRSVSKSSSRKTSTETSMKFSAPAEDSANNYNPYMSQGMYSASFMSHEGSQSIQSLIGSQPKPAPVQQYAVQQPYQQAQYNQYTQPPPQAAYPPPSYPPPSAGSAYTGAQYPPSQQVNYPPPGYSAPTQTYGQSNYPANTQYSNQYATHQPAVYTSSSQAPSYTNTSQPTSYAASSQPAPYSNQPEQYPQHYHGNQYMPPVTGNKPTSTFRNKSSTGPVPARGSSGPRQGQPASSEPARITVVTGRQARK